MKKSYYLSTHRYRFRWVMIIFLVVSTMNLAAQNPIPVLTSPAVPATNVSSIPVTVNFGEAVNGFEYLDLSVFNGYVTSVTNIGVGIYTFDVSPSVPGAVRINLMAGKAYAADDGKPNNAAQELKIMWDITAPFPSISSMQGNPTAANPIPMEINFGEEVMGFTSDDLTFTNGSIQNLIKVGTGMYKFEVTGLTNGSTMQVFLAADKVQDLAGNLNMQSNIYQTTYNNATQMPTPADAGSYSPVCADNLMLMANSPSVGTGMWSVVMGGINTQISNISDPFTQVTGLKQGENILRWTITTVEGNQSWDDVTIINDTPTPAEAGMDINACTPTVKLSGNPPMYGSGDWSLVGPSSGIFMNGMLYNTEVTNMGFGENTFRWTITNGTCASSDDVIVTNNAITSNAGGDMATCGSNALLNANDPAMQGATGEWLVIMGSAFVSNQTLYNSTVDNLSAGTNILRWSVTKGACSVYDEVAIESNQFTPFAGSDFTVCNNQAMLNAQLPAGASGEWSKMGGTATFANIYDPKTQVINLEPSTNVFIWTVTKGGCENSDNLIITNNEVSATVEPDKTVTNSFTTLNATDPMIGFGYWTVLGGAASITNTTLYNTTVTNLSEGLNTFRWTVTNNGCSANAELKVTLDTQQPVPVISSIESSPTGKNPIPMEVNFGEMVNNFDLSDIVVTNGTAANLVNIGNGLYKFDITNMLNGTVSVSIPQNTLTDALGHPNVASNIFNIGYDDNILVTNAGPDFSACVLTVNLNATPPPAGGYGEWSFLMGTGTFANISLHNTTVELGYSGDFELTWTVHYLGQTAYDNVKIKALTADAGGDMATCSDNVMMMAMMPPMGATGEWSKISGFGMLQSPSSSYCNVTGLGLGANVFRWTVSVPNGCSASDDVVITKNSMMVNAGPDKMVNTHNTMLNANNPSPGTGYWYEVSGNGATFDNPTAYNTIVNLPTDGVYSFEWSVNGVCYMTDIVEITKKMTQPYPMVTSPVYYHNLQPIPVDVNFGEPVVGFSPAGIAVYNGLVENFQNIDNQHYKFDVVGMIAENVNVEVINGAASDNAGNPSMQSSPLMIMYDGSAPYPTADAGPDQIICSGNSTYLIANALPEGMTGQWSGTGTFSNSTSHITRVDNLMPGNNEFLWIVYSGNVEVSDKVNVTVAVADAGLDIDTDCNNFATLTAAPTPTGLGNWINLSGGGANIVNPSHYNTQVTNISTGVHILRWTVNYGECIVSDDVIITNNQVFANAGPDLSYCGASAQLNASLPMGASGTWYVNYGPATVTDYTLPNSTVTASYGGSSELRWEVYYNGCVSSDIVMVESIIISNKRCAINTRLCTYREP